MNRNKLPGPDVIHPWIWNWWTANCGLQYILCIILGTQGKKSGKYDKNFKEELQSNTG